MKILKADLFHLFKDKLFYLLLGLTFLLPLFTCIFTNSISSNIMDIDSFIFQGLSIDIISVLIGIQLASFIGKEYQNNTIRNKICYGEGKIKVAIVFLLDAFIISLLFITVSLIGSLLFGIIFCEHNISDDFIAKLLCQCLIIISFSICVASVIISSKSMKSGLIFVILISLLLGSVSYVFPVAAASNKFMAFLSRILYMVVSNMLLKSDYGIYKVTGYTFTNLYLNAILVSLIYILVSISICLLIVRKQEYK
ncbi:MAG: ABC transporter permease [Bacilli bacterium]